LVNENRWRAMRYGSDEGLLDLAKGEIVEFRELLQEILEQIDEDAQFLGCEAEVAHARTIVQRGTSAHQQVKVYEAALAEGKGNEAALRDVVAFLIARTSRGT
jgi:carboxylate-amine ligase